MNTVEVVLREAPLYVASEIESWIASIKSKIGLRILENLKSDTSCLDRYIEVAEIREIPGAFICCSFYQQDINDALTRMGLFMGAGKGLQAGTLTKQTDFSLINYKKLVAGHNLPGNTILDFYKATDVAMEKDFGLNAAEGSFRTVLESPRLKSAGEEFYVIGFSIQSMKNQKDVVSHEIFHAYYLLNRTYRDVVQKFWENVVSNDDKKAITQEIGRAYNVDVEDLVIDEFQAYLIQNGAEKERMKNFVPKYRDRLLQKLEEKNIELVMI